MKIPIDISWSISDKEWDMIMVELHKILEQLPWYKCIIPKIIWRTYIQNTGTITQYKWFNGLYTSKSKNKQGNKL